MALCRSSEPADSKTWLWWHNRAHGNKGLRDTKYIVHYSCPSPRRCPSISASSCLDGRRLACFIREPCHIYELVIRLVKLWGFNFHVAFISRPRQHSLVILARDSVFLVPESPFLETYSEHAIQRVISSPFVSV